MTATVSELGERALLARIHTQLGTTVRGSGRSSGLIVGIGDDAAVVARTRNTHTVLTTDALIEGVHFDRRFMSANDVGARAVAVNLSDLAAMGATPSWILLSLALPDAHPVAEVEQLANGVAQLAQRYGVVVIGGNLTRSPGAMMVDITAVGEVRPRRVLTRGGGRPGDALYVSGALGGAAAGLEMLRLAHEPASIVAAAAADRSAAPAGDACVTRYRRPDPRLRLGMSLAHTRAARAAMDLSDGLADAADQIATASGCGVEIDADCIPIEPSARAWWEAAGADPVARALSGGDDYELLFAVARSAGGRLRHVQSRVAAPPLTRVGVLTNDPSARVLLRNGNRERLPLGFDHFSRPE